MKITNTCEQNKTLARRLEQALNARQLDVLDDIMAPNVVRHCQATPAVDVRNREQFKAFMRQDTAVFPDSVHTFTQILAEGDWVSVWAKYEGTQHRQMGPFPPSGKKVIDPATIELNSMMQTQVGVAGSITQHGSVLSRRPAPTSSIDGTSARARIFKCIVAASTTSILRCSCGWRAT
ncbi:MAG: ester cyclase [Panacagrimonas sp.]